MRHKAIAVDASRGGNIFVTALQITVIPYVMVALITSLGQPTLKDAKILGPKAGGVLLVLWVIGLTALLASPLAFPNSPSASFFSTSQIQEPAAVDFLQLNIPSNIFASLANAIVPAIVVFSILFGVALIRVGAKRRVVDLLCLAPERQRQRYGRHALPLLDAGGGVADQATALVRGQGRAGLGRSARLRIGA